MLRSITSSLASILIASLFLSGCGDGAPKDTVAPSVIASSPDDAAEGVFPDASVTITFSEPMDTASVEGAYGSDALPAASVSFSWNAEGTALTITPAASLELALAYTVELSTDAVDLAGNALDAAFSLTFTTADVEIVQVTLVPSLSGTEFNNSTNSSNLWIGDTSSGLQYMPVVSFNIGGLPEYTLGIAEATLSASQSSVTGSPYEGLGGEIIVSSVSFAPLTSADEAEVHDEIGVFSDSAALSARLIDVTEAARRDYENRSAQEGLSQYRFLFDVPMNENGEFDFATFPVDTFELEVAIYVLP